MKSILLVAENKASVELLESINKMIEANNDQIRYKIGQIKKVSKDKSKYPQLKLNGGKILTNINDIYLYFMSDMRQQRQRQLPPRGYEDDLNPYRNSGMDYSDMILNEGMDYDESGKPMAGREYDDEPVSYRKRKSSDSRYTEEESDDERAIDVKSVYQSFNEKRGSIQVPQVRKNPTEQRISGMREKRKRRYDSEDEPPRERERVRGKSSIKARKSEFSEEYSLTDGDDDLLDGKRELENFYMNEAKSRGQD